MDENPKPSDEELERLRKENEALKMKLESQGDAAAQQRWRPDWRAFFAYTLVVVACLLALVGVFAPWLRATALDTDVFVSKVGPLVGKDEVATVVADKAVNQLFTRLDVEGRLKDRLPEALQFTAGPLTDGAETLAKKAAMEILKSDQFAWLWEHALTITHSNMVGIIRGEKAIEIQTGGAVVLDIGELLTNIQDRLVQAGLTFLDKVPIPESAGQVTLFEADQLGAIKGGVNLLDTLYWLLPLLALLCFVGAVLLARDRRKTLMAAGIGLAIVMGVALVVLGVSKQEVSGMLASAAGVSAFGVIWTSMAGDLVATIWAVLALGVVVGAGAAVVGPYKWAEWLRTRIGGLFQAWRDRRQRGEKAKGPVGTFLNAHAWGFRIGGIVLLLFILILLPKITVAAVITGTVIYLVYLAVIELLR
jgi:hypothetical protein